MCQQDSCSIVTAAIVAMLTYLETSLQVETTESKSKAAAAKVSKSCPEHELFVARVVCSKSCLLQELSAARVVYCKSCLLQELSVAKVIFIINSYNCSAGRQEGAPRCGA